MIMYLKGIVTMHNTVVKDVLNRVSTIWSDLSPENNRTDLNQGDLIRSFLSDYLISN